MINGMARSKGENYKINELAILAREGKLRVPEFQRSFRWETSDILALFDSILRGYPVGSVLLWKKKASAKRITLGALTLDAPSIPDALWVIDGQQRITSLVNAVDPEAFTLDNRFKIFYVLKNRRFTRSSEARGLLSIPLPDLFDISRLLKWLQEHPEAHEYASDLQDVTARLRDFELPASVIDGADESVLRDIFDRMNTAGKRLRSAEIFDAIHRAEGDGQSNDLSIAAIADRIASSTRFGRLDEVVIYQAILVRRHPDVTRDPHGEFDAERRQRSDQPNEGRDEAYLNAEKALETAISFLSSNAGVPHITFLPYRFLLLVLVRFFALFPNPSPRNIELLSRWFWTTITRAAELNLNGSTKTVRSLAGKITAGDEDGSVQRLLESVRNATDEIPALNYFRANQAASKVVVCALWSLGPRDLRTGEPMDATLLASALEETDTPAEALVDVFPRNKLSKEHRYSAGNRLLTVLDDSSSLALFMEGNADPEKRADIMESHLLDDSTVGHYVRGERDAFIALREAHMFTYLEKFLRQRTGHGFEPTPPLESLDLDEEFNASEDDALYTRPVDL